MKRALVWVLWSPRHAAIAGTVLVVALVSMVVIGVSGGSDRAPAATPSPSATTSSAPTVDGPTPQPRPTTTAPAAKPGVTAAGEKDESATSADAATSVRAAAQKFTTAWLTGRTADRATWLSSLRPLCAPAFLPFVSATPAAAIPNATVKTMGAPDMGADVGTVLVHLSDGTAFTLEVMHLGQQWVVSGMEPA